MKVLTFCSRGFVLVTFFVVFALVRIVAGDDGKADAIGFVNEKEFESECKAKSLELTLFNFERNSIALTDQFLNQASQFQSDSFLGDTLTFSSANTQLPLSFDIVTRGHSSNRYSGLELANVVDDSGVKQSVLQISSAPGNDDFSMNFRNRVYHKSSPYQQVYAVGLTICSDENTLGESMSFFSTNGELLKRINLDSTMTVNQHHDLFVGVVTNTPIGLIRFDENEKDNDPVGLKHIYFGMRDDNLLEGLDGGTRTFFWVAFNMFIVAMLFVDMALGGARSVVLKTALLWSCIWILLALTFNAGVFALRGRGPALVWLTSYLLEKFLSIDNLFVFVTLFSSFRTPAQSQHKVLTWGIIGAIVLRAIFIFTGVLLVEKFSWLLAFFGGFLCYTGVKTIMEVFHADGDESDSFLSFNSNNSSDDDLSLSSSQLKDNMALSIVGSIIPLSKKYDKSGRFFVEDEDGSMFGDEDGVLPISTGPGSNARGFMIRFKRWLAFPFQFLVRIAGLDGWKATPLFAVLVIVETTDMVFAADSIPAVLSITQDPFIAYTSNIFAILGLRALYFALTAAMTQFEYLGPGLGIILLFIGVKLLVLMFGIHISVELTLSVVLGTILVAVIMSIIKRRHHGKERCNEYVVQFTSADNFNHTSATSIKPNTNEGGNQVPITRSNSSVFVPVTGTRARRENVTIDGFS
eukprot:m.26482 g.26482  ORF g.26482 m.26482 type:complete len:692 (+) comp5860_c0_seq1:16-2091(+)